MPPKLKLIGVIEILLGIFGFGSSLKTLIYISVHGVFSPGPGDLPPAGGAFVEIGTYLELFLSFYILICGLLVLGRKSLGRILNRILGLILLIIGAIFLQAGAVILVPIPVIPGFLLLKYFAPQHDPTAP